MKVRDLSVVVPYAGTPSIRLMLESLREQTIPVESREIIFVSTEEAAPLLSQLSLPIHTRVVTARIPQTFKGHTAALLRNAGAQTSRSRVLLFADSDAIFAPDCLMAHLQSHHRRQELVTCGLWHELPIDKQTELRAGNPSFDALLSVCELDYRLTAPSHAWEMLYSGNVSISARAFRIVGGFDEAGFRCHDIDLGYRLFKAGVTIQLSPACRAIHIEHPRSVTNRLEQANGFMHLGQRFPEIRTYAEDIALNLRRSHSRIVSDCNAQFESIVAQVKGIRIGNTLVLPPHTSQEKVDVAVRAVPRMVHTRPFQKLIQLRLDRNCWDFTIVQPNFEVLAEPKISLLVPAYNASRTLGRALSSVFIQTVQAFEIIVIDDASSDHSEEIFRIFSVDSRFRKLRNTTNVGQSRSLNRGLELARAPYIMQLDADDWLEPTAIERILDEFARFPGTGAVFACDTSTEHPPSAWLENGRHCLTAQELLFFPRLQVPRSYCAALARDIGGWSIQDPSKGRFFEDRLMLSRVSAVAPVRGIVDRLYNVDVTNQSLSRRAPFQTACAKYAILASEASRLRRELHTKLRSATINGSMPPRRYSRLRNTWSIIIPAHDRVELLRYSLRSWAESDALRLGSEVIIVDDRSKSPNVQEVCNEFPGFKVIRSAKRGGPARARNLGAAHAIGEMLLFADGDRIVSPDVISAHSERHRRYGNGGAIVVGGLLGRKVATYLETSAIAPSILDRILEQTRFDGPIFQNLAAAMLWDEPVDLPSLRREATIWNSVQSLTFADPYLSPWAARVVRNGGSVDDLNPRVSFLRLGTGILSLSADMFRALGPFDPECQPMEDWDYGARAQKMGVTIVSGIDLDSLHQLHPSCAFLKAKHRGALIALRRKHRDVISEVLKLPSAIQIPGVHFLTYGKDPVAEKVPPKLQSGSHVASLTFDDGPHPVGTTRVMKLMTEFRVTGTMFILGCNINRNKGLLRELAAAGNEIAVHGWNHVPPNERTSEELRDDLQRTVDVIQHVTDQSVRYCRPPYGKVTRGYIMAAQEVGLTPVGWDISTRDWSGPSATELIRNIAIAKIGNRIVLFHDAIGDLDSTLEALRWLLRSSEGRCHFIPLSVFAGRHGLPQCAMITEPWCGSVSTLVESRVSQER